MVKVVILLLALCAGNSGLLMTVQVEQSQGIEEFRTEFHLMEHEEQYKRIGEMPVEQGQYFLRPYWKEDYVRRTRNAIGISPYPA